MPRVHRLNLNRGIARVLYQPAAARSASLVHSPDKCLGRTPRLYAVTRFRGLSATKIQRQLTLTKTEP